MVANADTRTAEERVHDGASYLDTKIPDWHDQIDVTSLDMADECKCVLGQLAGNAVNLDRFGWERTEIPDDEYTYYTFIEATEAWGIEDDSIAYGFDRTSISDIGWEEEKYDSKSQLLYADLRAAWVAEINIRRQKEIS